MAKKYDSTIARIAGNLLSGVIGQRGFELAKYGADDYAPMVEGAVMIARAIVTETERTEPKPETV